MEGVPGTTLTYRELQCIAGVATGASDEEIGFRLNVTCNTVKTHLRRAFCKLRAANRTHAVVLALAGGYLEIADREGAITPGPRHPIRIPKSRQRQPNPVALPAIPTPREPR